MARDVKKYLLETSEKLSRQAYDEGDLKVCDIAESVCNFYEILPSDTFKDNSTNREVKSKPVKVVKKR